MANVNEPLLNADDRRIFERWRGLARRHANGSRFGRRLEESVKSIEAMHARCPDAYLTWSAGKDSTALVHLVGVVCGIKAHVLSIKDDLDFPGEVEYVERLGVGWGLHVDVVTPPFSLQDWLRESGASAGADLHSRSAAFSRRAFYDLIDAYREARGCPGVYLGLRADESPGRRASFCVHGDTYRKTTGEVVCTPLAKWSALDVWAYLAAQDIDMLDVYKCIRLNAEDPLSIRKSWWVPGTSARHGQTIWLKTYWPSLFNRLLELMPESGRYA